ncbi:MAG: ATP-binding protein [Gemmatimonadetes bacterium]|nr:ATP-binding protein [Gemmatimonadota bacterium]
MARADLLKRLFIAYRDSDRNSFMEVARSIVDEERRKHHSILANELLRILDNGVVAATPSLRGSLHPAPRDQERKTPLLEVRQPARYFQDLVLDTSIRKLLLKVIREFREWDVLESSGLWPSNKLLFCGPPGCGKTVTAEVIASELGLPLVYIRFDSVVSSLLGETASNLRKVFEYIHEDTWVVLFDEFDAIGRSRDDVTEHGEIKRVVNSFLQMLDSSHGRSLIIAATNFEQALDPAIWRRFDEIIRFERPTASQIEEMFSKKLDMVKNPKVSTKRYLKQLEGCTFGDIERVSLDILKACALDGRTILQNEDIETALCNQDLRSQAMQKAITPDRPKVDIQ